MKNLPSSWKGLAPRQVRLLGVACAATLMLVRIGFAADPPKSSSKKNTASAKPKTAVKSTAKKAPAKPQAKRYLASIGKSAPKPAASKTAKPAKQTVAAKTRAIAHDAVFQTVADLANVPVENSAALIPFFEQLYRHQRGEMQGPVRILHYGDSHTAADEWTGELRNRFQEKFGDGGSGYSLAGRPWNGYRRFDVRSGSTRGWHTDGLVGRSGDGIYGLGGVSMTATKAREGLFVHAGAATFELFYHQRPGGGAIQLFDNGTPVEQISTDGESAPGYYRIETTPGEHRFEVETLDRSPVRLFGWVAENSRGVTYETLGINGAAASIVLDWDKATLQSNIARRDPALIVLAYGTNEAGQKHWTLESYRETFERLIVELREAAPAATILVIGPPDRMQRVRGKAGWQTMDKLDMIVEAQRQAAYATGAPFWDQRAKMGGKGSMADWVTAGLAQSDRVHFTGPGYRMVGDAVFRDLMSQYDIFLKAREEIVAETSENIRAGN